MEAPEGTAARKRPAESVSVALTAHITRLKRVFTFRGVEIDLDGGVSAGVEDLGYQTRSARVYRSSCTVTAYLACVDFGDRHGGGREGWSAAYGGGLLKSAQN